MVKIIVLVAAQRSTSKDVVTLVADKIAKKKEDENVSYAILRVLCHA